MLPLTHAERRGGDQRGFTLVELLVVVLIIGILSAIAIPIFVGQQDQAHDAAAKSDIANAKQALFSSFNVADASYTDLQDFLTNYGLVVSDGTSGLQLRVAGSDDYCFQEVSASGVTFHTMQDEAVQTGACVGTSPVWAYDYGA